MCDQHKKAMEYLFSPLYVIYGKSQRVDNAQLQE